MADSTWRKVGSNLAPLKRIVEQRDEKKLAAVIERAGRDKRPQVRDDDRREGN